MGQEVPYYRIAGLVLAPINDIKTHPAIESIVKYGFDDTYINAMARDFAVSKEVILYNISPNIEVVFCT